jgi:hypothetical protein
LAREPKSSVFRLIPEISAARGSLLDSGKMLRVRFPMRSLNYFNLPSSSNRIMALVLIQPVSGTFLWNKARPPLKDDNFTAICDPIF